MVDSVEKLRLYRRRGAVLDSNLLLLLLLGSYDRNQITNNKRLKKYSPEDFDLLGKVLKLFVRVVTTPNILTEVSNLSDAIPEPQRAVYFAKFAKALTLLDEQHVPSAIALASRWARFGLTDAAIAEIARSRYLVLTDDLRLAYALETDGIRTLNFNELRYVYSQA